MKDIRQSLIVEDLPAAQVWMHSILAQSFPGVRIDVADSLASARQKLKSPPDLVLVDLNLPDGNGLDIIRELKQQRKRIWCIVTTIYDDDSHLFPALIAGADGYLLKDQDQADLCLELQRILKGQPPLSPSIARRVLGSFKIQADPLSEPLTTRQQEVLKMIAQGDSIQTVANKLGISYHTAASHIRGIYQRLNVGTRAEATAKAIRLGLD